MVDIEIPEGIVPISYRNDPQTEDVISSLELREGMIVLIEDYASRLSPISGWKSEASTAQANTDSRWCKVTKLRRGADTCSFVGVYSDGTKSARTYDIDHYWFVKIDSIPENTIVQYYEV